MIILNLQSREILELFVEKTTYLENTDFAKRGESITSFDAYKTEDGKLMVEHSMPTKEERDSFLLTFRLFIQKNERISIMSLEKLYGDKTISSKWKNKHHTIRTALNKKLQQESIDSPKYGILTHDEIMRIYLYGYLGHLNKDKLEKFRYFTKDETSSELFEYQFYIPVIYVLNSLIPLKHASIIELSS